MSADDAQREGWLREKESAHLYRVLANCETGSRAELFDRLAESAEAQAGEWAELLRDAGSPPAPFRPSMRTRLVAALARRLGPRSARLALAAMKVRGLSLYTSAPGKTSPMAPAHEAQRHGLLRSGGQLRAAVFGVNDGLVSNACLILGVAGATADAAVVLVTGVAGLLAGAFSMAAGEYVSVRSQREFYEHQMALERAELETYPEEEAAEFALIYRERGIPAGEAERAALRLIADPERALDVLAREELGIAPDQLGSPWGAAASSFVAFATGAAVPLAPFLIGGGTVALAFTVGGSATALLGVGAALSLFTGRGAWASALRMLAIGAAAAGLTHALGRVLGTTLV